MLLLALGLCTVVAYLNQGLLAPAEPSWPSGAAVSGHPVVGCWRSVGNGGNDSIFPRPQWFRLGTDGYPSQDGSRRFSAELPDDLPYLGLPWEMYWVPYPDTGEVFLAWGNGVRGLFTRARVHEGRMKGRLWMWTDVGHPRATEAGEWERAPCGPAEAQGTDGTQDQL